MRLDFNCLECDEVLKKERGCETKGTMPFFIGGDKHYRCPRTLISKTSWEYIHAYRFYKKNMLPGGGSYLAECKKYLDAMATLEDTIERYSVEQVKQTQKKKK